MKTELLNISSSLLRYIFVTLLLLSLGASPLLSDGAMAADKKTSAQTQRQKQAEQKAKQRERQRAQAQKAREQKAKQRARVKEQSNKQKSREQERRAKEIGRASCRERV